MGRHASQSRGREQELWSSSRRRRRAKSGRSRGKKTAVVLLVAAVCLAAAAPWAMQPDNLRPQKNWLQSTLYGILQEDAFQGEAMLLADLSSGSVVASRGETEPVLPASLAKLFVVEYAVTLADPSTVVPVSAESLSLVKEGSSMAWIQGADYCLKDLFAAMLVPSGNDASYAVADYCGGLISPQSAPGQERVDAFMSALAVHLEKRGYTGTALYDPSGFDLQARTTAKDLYQVTAALLAYPWFREIVSQSAYTAALPDGTSQTWENTNEFLSTASPSYDARVKGVKTGSLEESYNLVTLYEQHGKAFLVCVLGCSSDAARYEEAAEVFRTIDESGYLAW